MSRSQRYWFFSEALSCERSQHVPKARLKKRNWKGAIVVSGSVDRCERSRRSPARLSVGVAVDLEIGVGLTVDCSAALGKEVALLGERGGNSSGEERSTLETARFPLGTEARLGIEPSVGEGATVCWACDPSIIETVPTVGAAMSTAATRPTAILPVTDPLRRSKIELLSSCQLVETAPITKKKRPGINTMDIL